MMNIATSSVTVNCTGYADATDAIVKAGYAVIALDAVQKVADGTYKCLGCFVPMKRRK